MAADGSVIIDILGDAKQFSQTLKGVAKNVSSSLAKPLDEVTS